MAEPNLPEEHPWVKEGAGRVRFGLGVSSRAPAADWALQREVAVTAEQLGFDSLWAPDHPAYVMDCWSTLAAFAAITERVRLGTTVTCVLLGRRVVPTLQER